MRAGKKGLLPPTTIALPPPISRQRVYSFGMSTVSQQRQPSMASTNLQAVYPHVFVKNLVGKPIVVRLKWNRTEYSGTLVAVDKYMNLQIELCHELVLRDGKRQSEELGEVFVRCNNVLYIRGAEQL